MYKKYIFSFLIIALMLININIDVYASNFPNIQNVYDKFWDDLDNLPSDDPNIMSQLLRTTGLIVSSSRFLNMFPIATLKDMLNIPAGTSLKDYVNEHIDKGDDDAPGMDSQLNDDVKTISNYYLANCQYFIGYTFNVYDEDNYSLLGQSRVDAISEYVSEFQDEYYCVFWNNLTSSVIVPKNNNYLNYFNNNIYTDLRVRHLYAPGEETVVYFRSFSLVGNTYVEGQPYSQALTGIRVGDSTHADMGVINGAFILTSRSSDEVPILLYNSDSDVIYQQTNNLPFYYNRNSWHSFTSSSGDYTFSPTNINTVDYGDITEYITEYKDDHNGLPPTLGDININIDNENNNNISGDGGSGDGGSGDGGSGDGGSGDGIGDIFGWLKGLGSAIASLIKGIGEFLTEIIAGLTEALTKLIGGISDLIISVTETIPSVYMEFLRACFGWMPDEWVGLFGAAVLVMVLVGIIKIIRG